jgi:hypothetical protein
MSNPDCEAKKPRVAKQLWEISNPFGAPRKFDTAEELWEACLGYFEWVKENPLLEGKVFNGKNGIVKTEMDKMRAMTIGGMCVFINVDEVTWRKWRKERPELSSIIKKVENIIFEQKFTGAAADLLNSNIIARDLGLSDKKTLEGPNGGPVSVLTASMTTEEKAAAFHQMISGETSISESDENEDG